ncbi:hypothetical protein FNW02_22890 [Komarekiella sp. 'clone 1']|uniref:Uncharacterized protein n=1 Tax=Komarekiella delphini-convector SJRDD-AB1 TaxID=2593771 RepID=A0AA40T0U7_9NOST|nr:hypothetical protein [Komarekiella delphini-convector]MBD6618594.1 hypothetical protein [Komarekiella delphini-convector SJRDD-AB1]
MQNSEDIQVGDRVLILSPSYVAGKYGVVLSRESRSDNQASQRWLIQVEDVDSPNIVVSLVLDEFVLISPQ